MKKYFVLLPVFAALAYISLSSNVGGLPGNYTGSISGYVGCGSSNVCHGKSDNEVIISFALLDSAGNSIYQYVGGKNYQLKMIIGNATSLTLPKYGFQFTTVASSTSAFVGNFLSGSLPAGERVDTLGSSVVVQQITKLSPSTGLGAFGTVYTATAGWVAPPAGTGKIKIFGTACLVNDNTLADTLTDRWNAASLAVDEKSPALVNEVNNNSPLINAWPNPVNNQLNLTICGPVNQDYTVIAYNLNGKKVTESYIFPANTLNNINTTNWPLGIYELIIKSSDEYRVLRVIKQ